MISVELRLAFAKLVSVVFHPAILILLLPFLVIYRQTAGSFYAMKWQIFSSLFVFLAGFLVYLGERVGVFSDADISKRPERDKFYLMITILTVLFMAIAIILEGIIFVPVIIAFGVLFGVLLFAALNHILKISIHSGVMCTFVVTMGLLYGINAFFATIWILPLVIWARVVLKKHSFKDAFWGAFLGAGITLGTFFIGRGLL